MCERWHQKLLYSPERWWHLIHPPLPCWGCHPQLRWGARSRDAPRARARRAAARGRRWGRPEGGADGAPIAQTADVRLPAFAVARCGWRGGEGGTGSSMATTPWHGRREVAAAAAVAAQSVPRTTDRGPGESGPPGQAQARSAGGTSPAMASSNTGNTVGVDGPRAAPLAERTRYDTESKPASPTDTLEQPRGILR